MALAKISLKLGKKKIELTPAQFEELKQDMRELDKHHHYYWNLYPHREYWWGNSAPYITYTTSNAGGSLSAMPDANIFSISDMAALPIDQLVEPPPSFKGSVLSFA